MERVVDLRVVLRDVVEGSSVVVVVERVERVVRLVVDDVSGTHQGEVVVDCVVDFVV